MSLRIASGRLKGRLLKTPSSETTRPTTGMLRQAVFNICQDWVDGARFLDLFAGSGAMGFEAISRGAKSATFVEKDRLAIQCIRENAAFFGVEPISEILGFDAKQALLKLTTPFDLIYIDPPYDGDIRDLFTLLMNQKLLNVNGLIFLEERFVSKKTFEFSGLELITSRKYGGSYLHQFRHSLH